MLIGRKEPFEGVQFTKDNRCVPLISFFSADFRTCPADFRAFPPDFRAFPVSDNRQKNTRTCVNTQYTQEIHRHGVPSNSRH